MPRLTDSLTLRGRCFLAAGSALVVCGLVLGFREITRIGVLVGALPLLVGLIGVRRGLHLRTERTVIPGRVSIDQVSDVVLTVVNEDARPTPILMAEEQVDYALGDRPRFVIPRLAHGERQQLPYRVRSNVRGRHRLGPLALRVKDPFDLSVRLAVVADVGEVIVLPRVVDLATAGAAAGVGAEGTIPHMVALHGEDDVSVREYRDGDDLRRIHWPATARSGELMVRQEDRPSRRRAVIVLDDRDSTGSGPRSGVSFEWAITMAASVAALLSRANLSVHLVCGGVVTDAPSDDSFALDNVLEALAVAELAPPDVFAHSLSVAADRIGDGAMTVAVVGPLAEHETIALARLHSGGSPALALVMDLAGANSGLAARTADDLRTHGWTSALVANGTSVPDAWSSVATSLTAVRR
jgi:uncharacterized protein (DUF58 family)